MTDLAILFEHPTWQQPLFDALESKGIPFEAHDLKRAAFDVGPAMGSRLVFSQASPSAYTRGNGRSVPYTLSLLEHFEETGAKVLNGSAAFRFELSKLAQMRLLDRLGMHMPWTLAFNHVDGLRGLDRAPQFPCILKPNQGGSGARMAEVSGLDELQSLLDADASYWEPDPVLLLQELLVPHPEHPGIVRMEFVGGQMLYAMRVLNTDGFNLCPSEDCNPVDGNGMCAIPTTAPPEFHPYPDVPVEAVEEATRLFKATGFDVGGLEYMVTTDGRRVFYDMNANSNLRRPVGLSMGFDPFDRVADWLAEQLAGLE
ncbi:MAG: hypothetical protein ACJAYU_001865 [Bradymonadia bacterium]|jgi:hypothetical protein